MNDVYTAIMKAADQIEWFPKDFRFSETCIPACGSPGCALGWIGAFLGVRNDGYNRGETNPPFFVAARQIIPEELTTTGGITTYGRPDRVFYTRMDELDELNGTPPARFNDWRHNAAECARCLRLYAAKYHGIPNSVRELCEVPSCPTILSPNLSPSETPITGSARSPSESLSATSVS